MRRRFGSLVAPAAFTAAAMMGTAADASTNLWNAVTAAPDLAAAHELRAAEQAAFRAPPPGAAVAARIGSAEVERHLRAAIGWSPRHFEARRRFAEFLLGAGEHRRREALVALEAARRVAPTKDDDARLWAKIGGERARLGEYDAALDAYERRLALADPDGVALASSAAVLMVLGRLEDAIARFREAIAYEEAASAMRGPAAALAAFHLGLAVALDRSGNDAGALDASRRSVALDPGSRLLAEAMNGSASAHLFPGGDADYALGLVRLAQGRAADAAAAFQSFLRRHPRHRYGDQARRRLAFALNVRDRAGANREPGRDNGAEMPRPDAGTVRRRGVRVAREATLAANGPLAAPLIDSGFRMDPTMLDGCLTDVALPDGVRQQRVRVKVTIGGNGRVTRAEVRLPTGFAPEPGRCIEQALTDRLRVVRPGRPRPTEAELELVLAPVEGGAL